ncbi:hypothetical protein HDV06_003035 [Boothiomyces sp. JEL0866]|nr:hypothetical protein HDV06_003035 [Boothiomyces sp. JEL0866]
MSFLLPLWKNGICTGPPDIMYHFNDSITSPSFYTAIINWDLAYGYCGLSPVYLDDNCCYFSKNLTETEGYTSGGLSLVVSNPTKVSPIGANNNKYCHLYSDDSNNFFGMLDLYVLQNGACNLGVSCSNGVLKVFNDTSCNSLFMQSPLKLVTFINELNVTAEIITIENGTVKIYWTTILDYAFFPDRLSFANVACWLTMILMIIVYFYSVYLDYWNQTRLYWKELLIHNAWALSSITVLYDLFVENCPNWIPITQYASANVCSLMTVINGMGFWHRVSGTRKTVQVLSYIFILFLHLTLAGANYFIACYLSDHDSPICPYNILQRWFDLSFYWILYMFAQNTVPIVYFAWKVLSKARSTKDTFTKLNRDHRSVIVVTFFQIMAMVVYILCNLSMEFSTVLEGDEQEVLIISLKQLTLMSHALFNSILTNGLVAILKGRSIGSKLEPDEQPKMLIDTKHRVSDKQEISTMVETKTRAM